MNNNLVELFLNNKFCQTCKQVKEISEFKNKSTCKDCHIIKRKEQNKKYYQHKSVECPQIYGLKIK